MAHLIPPLNERGYLPPGVHRATLEEVVERFGRGSEQREAQVQSLRWLLPVCERAGVVNVLINGSFVTDRVEPNDVDCIALQGTAYRADSTAAAELREGFPFVELKIVGDRDYARFRDQLFSTDRDMIAKGVVEVVI